MVVSGKYSRYRSLPYCIYCDIRDNIKDSIRRVINRLKGKKEEKPPKKKNDGYGRWRRVDACGGEV